MRALLLAVLIALPALAGCTGGERQWAGVANAYQYGTYSLVEVQLHSTRVDQPGDAGTAHAGMVALESIADAVADVRLRNGTLAQLPITGWTFDRVNDVMTGRLDATDYDAFHMNATFVLKNGTRLRTHDPVRWHEEFTRPFYGIMDVRESGGSTTVSLSLYRVRDNATFFDYLGEGPEGTLSSANVSSVDAWSLLVRARNGTSFEETAQPRAGATTLTLTLPYVGIAEAEPRYRVTLKDGTIITQREVDRDVFPVETAIARQRVQQN